MNRPPMPAGIGRSALLGRRDVEDAVPYGFKIVVGTRRERPPCRSFRCRRHRKKSQSTACAKSRTKPKFPRHCEERSDVAIRSLSVPRWETGGALHRRGCGLPRACGPRNDVALRVLLSTVLLPILRIGRAILESPLREREIIADSPGCGVHLKVCRGTVYARSLH